MTNLNQWPLLSATGPKKKKSLFSIRFLKLWINRNLFQLKSPKCLNKKKYYECEIIIDDQFLLTTWCFNFFKSVSLHSKLQTLST